MYVFVQPGFVKRKVGLVSDSLTFKPNCQIASLPCVAGGPTKERTLTAEASDFVQVSAVEREGDTFQNC